jgi:glycerol kinase
LRVDGGMTQNAGFLQCLADITDCPVDSPAQQEMTVLGAAYLSALALGWIHRIGDIEKLRRGLHRYQPTLGATQRQALLRAWHRAVQATQDFADDSA